MLHDMFEHVFVINLLRRKERMEAFAKRLPADWPFRSPERYAAIDGGLATPPDWWKDGGGAWGCYKAHLRILEDCLSNEINSVLILEDDAVCVEGFAEKVQAFWKNLPEDWEMVYLGGQHIQEYQGLPRKINDWVYQPFNVNRTHCYGLRGRKMIERVYKHLNNIADWKVPHHVDHYLGELHKQLYQQVTTGLYVPKEWLVAQSEGKSDICGKELEQKLFPSAEETLAPVIDRRCCAVMGTYFSGINTLAGTMNELGLPLGLKMDEPSEPKQPHFFEDVYLREICRNSYYEPWLEEKRPQIERINHLRRWAGLQCKNMSQEVKLICGKHPMLSLMGAEIMEAWKEPKFICIERSPEESYESMKKVPWCWHPSAAKYSFNRLAEAREEFFEKYQPPLLRISYETLKSEPRRVIWELCDFLQYSSTPQQRHNAMALIRVTHDDLCFPQEIVQQQPVQVVQAVPVTPTHPSYEKRKKKRKKH